MKILSLLMFFLAGFYTRSMLARVGTDNAYYWLALSVLCIVFGCIGSLFLIEKEWKGKANDRK